MLNKLFGKYLKKNLASSNIGVELSESEENLIFEQNTPLTGENKDFNQDVLKKDNSISEQREELVKKEPIALCSDVRSDEKPNDLITNRNTKVKNGFNSMKFFYDPLFDGKKSINDIISVYISETNKDDIFNEIRLRYLSLYLFKSKITYERLSSNYLKDYIKGKALQLDKDNSISEQREESVKKEPIALCSDVRSDEKPNDLITNRNTKVKNSFNSMKFFYDPLFDGKKSINDIIRVYISETNKDDIFNEIRLRYLSLYLFKSKITDERLSSNYLSEYIKVEYVQIDTEEVTLSRSLKEDCLMEQLYSDIKTFVKDQLVELNDNRSDVHLLLMSTFLNYDIHDIGQSYFLGLLFKVIKDVGLLQNIHNENDFTMYLKERFLYVENVKFWDSDEGKLYDCCIFFVERYIGIKYDEIIRLISNFEDGTIYVNATELNSAYATEIEYMIHINGNSLVTNKVDKDKVIRYYDFINKEITIEIDKDVDVIYDVLGQVSEESFSEIMTIAKNYLEMIPQSILLNREYYIAFEHLISFDDYLARRIVLSTLEERDNIIDKLNENLSFLHEMTSFIDNSYRKFVKMVSKHFGSSDSNRDISSSLALILLRTVAPNYFANIWSKEYGIYIGSDTHINELDEYIDLYCRCSDIPTKNITSIGMLTYYLMESDTLPESYNLDFVKSNLLVIDKIFEKTEQLEMEYFEKKLRGKQSIEKISYNISDIDLMNGYEFEKFTSLLFTKMGYLTDVTKGSGDQGIDVIAEKHGSKIGIQAKCYSNKVTNKSVQEVVAGLSYYECDKGIVVTNQYFTNSAIDLAEANGIILWDRDILKRKIEEVL